LNEAALEEQGAAALCWQRGSAKHETL